MRVKTFCAKRKLEMVGETQALEQERQKLTAQGQQMQARMNQVNVSLAKLEIELELLDKLESSQNGGKEDAGK